MSELADHIENYLRQAECWISATVLSVEFNVDAREFRSTAGKPGLLSDFAISGNAGFRHIECCTAEEWERFSQRIRSHGIGELVRVRRLRFRRNKLTRQSPPPVLFEKHSPQRVMFELEGAR